ncbi:MAG: hypothetical protein EBZ48_03375, partial [Proteobacteria bacterium]|nr:hypothetical protein [Pseudomonadota bacterium]
MQLLSTNLDELANQLGIALKTVQTPADLELIKRDWVGKDGILKVLFKQLKDVPQEQRPAVAAKLNDIRSAVESFIAAQETAFGDSARMQVLERELMDLSLPARAPGVGGIHPVTRVERRFAALLRPFGFR